MGVFITLSALLFIAAAPAPAFAEEYCSYMTAIPREDKPDEPLEIDEDVPWGERPLLPGPERPYDDVCMNQYRPSESPSMGSQVILMEEEIEGDVIIARLNYDGPNVPQIDRNFLSGSSALLGAIITKNTEDGQWYLIITQKQDYEAPGMQLYVFYISVEGEPLTVATSVQIVNIDDNRPMIQAFEACQVVELGEPGLTECVYEVSDLDGRISTQFMTFNITSDRNDDQIFYINGSNLENEWMRMHMTVGLRTPLDFDQNALHIFDVTAYDSLPNNHTVPLMVQVESLERRPPRWLEIFAVQQFDEKTNQSFPVRAIDGDIQFNRPIYYRIETAPDDDFFRIEATDGGGAMFYVDPIDRDTLERDVFQLSIIAYKLNDDGEEMINTTAAVVIIINDVNDNAPIPFHDEYSIAIREETAMTLDLEDFGFHDRDLGQNAQYTVRLQSVWPPGVHEAFTINPSVGYQRQTFIIGTVNHTMLDFEETDFQNITLLVVATDMNRTELVGNAILHIHLINWNDELPIFEHDSLTVTFNETEGEGFFVGNLRANDRDIGDRVEHSLMGNVADFLTIDKDTGDIYVLANDSFDYHRQNLFFVQVRADDTFMAPFHTAVSQLLIQLLDINNTPPTLRLPRGTFSTDENVPVGHLITDEITATDPDTTARLEFEIDWESSYATKQGRAADASEYHNCVAIIPFTNEGHPGSVRARIEVQEVRPGVTIDFEMFEVLYLTIKVYDRETYIGDDYDESTFTINIVDLNDNPPVWVEGTLEQSFSVRELSASGAVVGSVLATDIDGPLYNQVRYTISPRNDTPPDLITIHFYTGQITVDAARAIDADLPPRWVLDYTAVASDCCYAEDEADCPPDPNCHNTEGELTINIIDTNNKVPQPDFEDERFNTTVYLLENATNLEFVSYIVANDLDRDELYHTVAYQINYAVNPLLLQLFAIELDTGELYVNYPEGSTTVLDRDGEHPTHQIFFNLFDNFLGEGDGTRNQNEVNITVVLLDVNDNAPELPDPSLIAWSISENYSEGTSFLPIIHAPDIDQPDTPNSLVGFEIGTLRAIDRDLVVPDLVDIRSIDTDKGELFTAVDLRGYWGTYDMPIRAFDHGHPQQESNEVYQLVVRPWNYHDPVFVFPLQDSVIRLSREQALASSLLQTTDGNFLERVHATDEDGGTAGRVSFAVIGDEEAVAFFDIFSDIDNYGTLSLRRNDITDMIKEFQVTIEATDGGTEPGVRRSQSTFTAAFVPVTGDPTFEDNTATVAFIELEEGLTERFSLPSAVDLKNHRCVNDCHDIYYRITDGNTEGHFGLDAESNTIYLLRELDRGVSAVHTLTVAASNLREPNTAPTAGSTLTVTVNVREADPRPRFLRGIYTAGISVGDTINRELLTVQAVHTDGLYIMYSINTSSMVVDPTLEAVKDHAFTLHPDTGVLTLNIQPTVSMHGMFEFHVVASDPVGGQDTANVRVYLISSLNRVIFTFVNTLQQIEASVDFIAQTFSAGFQMTCNIDQVLPSSDNLGIATANLTEVRSHFIRDDTPVLAEEIELIRSDTVLLRSIQTTLNTELLVLDDFFTDLSPEATGAEATQVTIYVLAALAALLGFLFLVLLATFIIKTRILNRRLEALSMTKYGSVDSGLNRAGLAAPGTNKHAVEGSNPIWNEVLKAPDFDTLSDVSDDSDLIGIEDLPQFRNDYFPPGDANSTSDILPFEEPLATHKNNFGFNATPFSPDFANRQFQRE